MIVLKDTANEEAFLTASKGSPLNVIYTESMQGNANAFVGSMNEAIATMLENKGHTLYYGSGLPLTSIRDLQVLKLIRNSIVRL